MTYISAPCALRPAPCALRPAPCALRPAPCALRPAPCALLVALLAAIPSISEAVVTVVPFGDSIVAGYDGAPMAGYRQDLLNDLATDGVQIQYQGVYDPTSAGTQGASAAMTALGQNEIAAFGGYNSLELLNDIDGDVPNNVPTAPPNTTDHGGYWFTGGGGTGRGALYPEIVLLQIGTNDWFTPGTNTDANITSILQWFEANRPNTSVFVSSPPPADYAVNPQSYVAGIQSIVSVENSWLANNVDLFPNDHYVDIYDSFLSGGSINASMLSADGVHPSDTGYAVMAQDYAAAIISVPEPAALAGLVACWGLLGRRRRIRI